MPRILEILDEATVEAAEVRMWYADRDERLAIAFMNELDRVIAAIVDGPDSWHPYRRHTRRCLFRRFPHFVVYDFDVKRIRVVAVVHAKRRPGYWGSRI